MARKFEFDKSIISDMKNAAGGSYADYIKMLPIEQLHDNANNFYDVSELEILADDIDRQGLKTPLYVVPAEDGYTIISGHRRKAAVQLLIDAGKYTSGKLPCYIGKEKSNVEMTLDLIMLNATARIISDADMMKQYQELESCYKQLEADGKKIGGRMREKIAAAMQVSPAQVGKIENINNNAIPEIKEAVEDGKMSISTANEAARLAPEEQQDLIEKKKPEEITHKEVKERQKSAAKPKEPPENEKEPIEIDPDQVYLDSYNDDTYDDVEETEEDENIEPEFEDNEQQMSENAEQFKNLALQMSENAERFKNLALLPEGYFNDIVDSGMCNSIITGYMLLAFDELCEIMSLKKISDDTLEKIINDIFDCTNASAARKRFNKN